MLFDNFFDNDFDFFMPVLKTDRNNSNRNYRPAYRPDFLKTDIKENEDSYELVVAVPGIAKENINVQLDKGYITVGVKEEQKTEEKDEKTGKYLHKEIYVGNSERSYFVGDYLKKEDVKAKFENGLLILSFPKKTPEKEQLPENTFIAIE